MILSNGKDCYTVTTDAQIDGLKACGFTETNEPEQPETKKPKKPETDRI